MPPPVATPLRVGTWSSLEGEKVLWRGRPTWRAYIGYFLKYGILALAIGVIVEVLKDTVWDGAPRAYAWGITVLLLLIVVLVGMIRKLQTLYTVTSERIHIRQGILCGAITRRRTRASRTSTRRRASSTGCSARATSTSTPPAPTTSISASTPAASRAARAARRRGRGAATRARGGRIGAPTRHAGFLGLNRRALRHGDGGAVFARAQPGDAGTPAAARARACSRGRRDRTARRVAGAGAEAALRLALVEARRVQPRGTRHVAAGPRGRAWDAHARTLHLVSAQDFCAMRSALAPVLAQGLRALGERAGPRRRGGAAGRVQTPGEGPSHVRRAPGTPARGLSPRARARPRLRGAHAPATRDRADGRSLVVPLALAVHAGRHVARHGPCRGRVERGAGASSSRGLRTCDDGRRAGLVGL